MDSRAFCPGWLTLTGFALLAAACSGQAPPDLTMAPGAAAGESVPGSGLPDAFDTAGEPASAPMAARSVADVDATDGPDVGADALRSGSPASTAPPVSEQQSLLTACADRVGCPWSARAPLPVGSRSHSAAVSGDTIYVFGGQTATEMQVLQSRAHPGNHELAADAYRETRSYDAVSDTWTRRAPMPVGLYSSTAHLVGSQIYVVGGYGLSGFSSALERYDAATDSWALMAPRPLARYTFMSAAIGGKIYVVGGRGPDPSGEWPGRPELEIYDVASDSWSQGAPAPQALSDGSSCALGERMYVFGGELDNATLVYDVPSGAWSEGAPPPNARAGAGCAAIGGFLFVLGGRDNGTGVELGLIERYDPATDTWRTEGQLPTPRYWFAAASLGSSIYSIGGEYLAPSYAPDYGLSSRVEVLELAL